MISFELVVPKPIKEVRLLPVGEDSTPHLRERDYDVGFEAGYREGQWKASLELQKLREKETAEWEEILSSLRKAHDKFFALVDEHLPQIFLIAINRLFQKHYFTTEQLAEVIQGLLKELTQAQKLRIECVPEELKQIQDKLLALGITHGQAGLEWKENPSLSKGEFLLQSDLGSVDGRRLARVAKIQVVLERLNL